MFYWQISWASQMPLEGYIFVKMLAAFGIINAQIYIIYNYRLYYWGYYR